MKSGQFAGGKEKFAAMCINGKVADLDEATTVAMALVAGVAFCPDRCAF